MYVERTGGVGVLGPSNEEVLAGVRRSWAGKSSLPEAGGGATAPLRAMSSSDLATRHPGATSYLVTRMVGLVQWASRSSQLVRITDAPPTLMATQAILTWRAISGSHRFLAAIQLSQLVIVSRGDNKGCGGSDCVWRAREKVRA